VPRYRTDERLNRPLSPDLLTDVAALYGRLGGPLTRALDPVAAIDEITTLLPYHHRVADVTRLIAHLLSHLPDQPGMDHVGLMVEAADAPTGSLHLRGTVASALLVAADTAQAVPRAVRDQFLLDAAEFAALPERLTGTLFSAAVLALRVVTEHVHAAPPATTLSRAELILLALAEDAAR
jgi:hypothetical protein